MQELGFLGWCKTLQFALVNQYGCLAYVTFRQSCLVIGTKFKFNVQMQSVFDKWFPSIDSAHALKQNNSWAVGAISCNRLKNCELENDKDLKGKEKGSCDFKSVVSEEIIVVKWYDSRPFYLISSYHGVHLIKKC